jgi:1,4-dihydroxy-2-naphthoate octaprenyltransferase
MTNFGAGLWRLADPKVSLASFAALALGAAAAAGAGTFHWVWFGLTFVGIFALEVAKNASGEVFDWDTGVDQAVAERDRSPFSGGKRVLVDGLLSRAQAWGIALFGYTLAIAAGLAIVTWREPRTLWLGLAGVALAYFYHAPPLRLAYRGLGELAVALAYGPLVTLGTFLVQTAHWDSSLAVQACALGLLIAAFLIANEIPDYHADRVGGKWNLVARLGRAGGARLFTLIAVLAWMLTIGLAWLRADPRLLGGLAGLPVSAWAAHRLLAAPEDIARVVPAQAASLVAFLLFALGSSCGLLLATF